MGGASEDAADEDPVGPPPQLISLTIEGDGAPVTTWPEFSPDIYRYAVRAADPQGGLVVTAEADADFELSVFGQAAESDKQVSLSEVVPGSNLDVVVESSSGEKALYEIIYLPNDFPELVVTTLEPGASVDPIYLTLVPGNFLAKVDHHGVPLFYEQTEATPLDFKRHADGIMSYAAAVTEQVLLNEDFEVVDRIKVVGHQVTDHHDFAILENGNFVLIAGNTVTRDVTEYGGVADQELLDFIYQEITPNREVVFEWNTWDRLKYEEAVALAAAPRDYAHPNALDIDEDGDWLISLRHFSQVLKIDRQSGDTVWRLGGLVGDFEFVDDPYNGFCAQHSARWSGEDRVILFDNGNPAYCFSQRDETVTRAAEYELDEEQMTATLIWSFEGPVADSRGSVQRLSNGNTFIGWGSSLETLATEVDPAGNVVFEMSAAEQNALSYRALRYAD